MPFWDRVQKKGVLNVSFERKKSIGLREAAPDGILFFCPKLLSGEPVVLCLGGGRKYRAPSHQALASRARTRRRGREHRCQRQCVDRVVTTSTRRLTLTPNTAFTLYKVNPGLIPGAETLPSQMYGYLSAFRSSLHPLIFHSIAFRIHIAIHSGPGFSLALYALLCHTHSLRPRHLTDVLLDRPRA